MTAVGEDLLAVHPGAIAEAALHQILSLANDAGSEDIRGVASMALASIDMHRRSRRGASRGWLWLGKVTSFAFPRCFTAQWGEPAKNHVCFSVELTEASKKAVGRSVEVQLPDSDAEKLARQILRLVEWRKSGGSR
ncbi:hypothetical protein [Streptomyces sp. SP18CM02]|uniref:hypothetical protein n=1 Tax=Streptomyces sp. SP18CM02 TaxID=2758571 RepID=UPI00168B88C3|nr:hypothetical protein [Streptomyces sp. SP18CM02]MBD3550924.1 hypothetical protein [Streptomyces sp. SP18CM02]